MMPEPLHPGDPQPCDLYGLDEDCIRICGIDGKTFEFNFMNGPEWYPEHWRRFLFFGRFGQFFDSLSVLKGFFRSRSGVHISGNLIEDGRHSKLILLCLIGAVSVRLRPLSTTSSVVLFNSTPNSGRAFP